MISSPGAGSTHRSPRARPPSSSFVLVLDSVPVNEVEDEDEGRGRASAAFPCILFIALLFAICGCSRSPSASSNTPAPAPRWNWESFPLSHRMRLGVLSCRILPKSSQTINSPFNALLHLSVDRQQTNLPAGFIWAEFEPKTLRAQSNALAEAKVRLQERERYMLEVEWPGKKVEVAKKLEDSRTQVAILEVLSTNQMIAPAALPVMPIKDRTVTPETLQRSKEELDTLRKVYQLLQETNVLAIGGADLQLGRTELQQRELEFEQKLNQAVLKIPFACQLNLSLQLAEHVSDYPVNSGQELAVMRDLSAILLRVLFSDPSWSTLPTDKLRAVISLPNGSRLEAPFAYSKLEKVQLREDVAYYFQFPTNNAADAARMMGTDASCELWLDLPEPARVISKFALVVNHQGAFQNRRWDEGVRQIDPNARVLVEGQTDLAITISKNSPKEAPKDEDGEK